MAVWAGRSVGERENLGPGPLGVQERSGGGRERWQFCAASKFAEPGSRLALVGRSLRDVRRATFLVGCNGLAAGSSGPA